MFIGWFWEIMGNQPGIDHWCVFECFLYAVLFRSQRTFRFSFCFPYSPTCRIPVFQATIYVGSSHFLCKSWQCRQLTDLVPSSKIQNPQSFHLTQTISRQASLPNRSLAHRSCRVQQSQEHQKVLLCEATTEGCLGGLGVEAR